jgi:sRNA-binding protein
VLRDIKFLTFDDSLAKLLPTPEALLEQLGVREQLKRQLVSGLLAERVREQMVQAARAAQAEHAARAEKWRQKTSGVPARENAKPSTSAPKPKFSIFKSKNATRNRFCESPFMPKAFMCVGQICILKTSDKVPSKKPN